MSNLDALERRWRETGDEADRQRWERALERAGLPAPIFPGDFIKLNDEGLAVRCAEDDLDIMGRAVGAHPPVPEEYRAELDGCVCALDGYGLLPYWSWYRPDPRFFRAP